jgi:methionyl aminopeptidase
MVIIKNAEQIEGIRQSSHLAARTLVYVSSFIRPGVSTQALNDIADKFIRDHQAIPAPLNYDGFPKSICTSVDDVVCHGIPSSRQILKNGNIINIDITTILSGYYGDVSATYPVGELSSPASLLIDRTKTALDMAISHLKPGITINESVGRVIEPYVRQFGYSVVRDLGGHGVGLKFHEDPFIFHFPNSQNDLVLKPGMVFTIEPMVNASSQSRITIDKSDGWTVRTVDGSLSAQFEHTVLITPTGHEVLTRLPKT